MPRAIIASWHVAPPPCPCLCPLRLQGVAPAVPTAPAHDPPLGGMDWQPSLLPVYRSLSRGAARQLAVGTATIRQELYQQRWEDGLSGWPGGLYIQQHRGKTKKSIYRLSG